MDTDLKALVKTNFEGMFPAFCVVSIDPTTIRSINPLVNAFVIIASPKTCQCVPKCTKEAIALTYGKLCAFLTEEYYDKLDEAAETIIKGEKEGQ